MTTTIRLAGLVAAAVLTGCAASTTATPAPAAPAPARPVYSTTVAVVYGQGVTLGYGSGKFDGTRWNVPAAVTASGVTRVKVVKTNRQVECYEVSPSGYCAFIGTAPKAIRNGNYVAGPSGVYLVVDRGLPAKYQLLESQVVMSDDWGKTHTAAERQAALAAAIKAAVPR